MPTVGARIRTDKNGQAVIGLRNGEYTFTVKLSGYAPYQNTVRVADAPQEVTVELERQPDPVEQKTGLLAEAAANPNPFTEELTLQGVGAARRIVLLNMAGTVVLERRLHGEQRVTLSVATLPAGVYLVRILADNEARTLRVVKQ